MYVCASVCAKYMSVYIIYIIYITKYNVEPNSMKIIVAHALWKSFRFILYCYWICT